MTTAVSPTPKPGVPEPEPSKLNPYGRFSADGVEYCITNPRTPRPWANIIANPRMGLAVSQTGSGFSWIDNSQLAVVTRWQQDFAQDSSGKFLYVREADAGETWSLAPAPTWPAYDRYECRHGIGYTTFTTELAGIRAVWTLFCDASETVELWHVRLENLSDRLRRLELCAFLEWNCGVLPSPRREFHKLFIETELDTERRAIFARNHMWEVPSNRFGHWNTDFPYVSALACTEPVLSAQGDKAAFLGRGGDFRAPAALAQDRWQPRFGRHEDPIAALRCAVELRGGESRTLGFVLAVAASRSEACSLLDRFQRVARIEESLSGVRAMWRALLAEQRISTPDGTLDCLLNDWLRYQAISARIWGRAGYYQQSGAYGFRDQLQDSQVWLTIDPARCRRQLELHARHQFKDGSVYHWWHPLSEQGHVTKMTDDLLWLAFVAASYIRETGDFSVLEDRAPYIDDAHEYPLVDHVLRAFERVFARTSPRGLPYIGGGDWNDGLSAVGLQERGESVWLAHFLAGLLSEWSEIFSRVAARGNGAPAPRGARIGGAHQPRALLDAEFASRARALAIQFAERRTALISAVNEHAWDGEWYIRATRDDGTRLGSRENREGRIYLNAQTWAVLNDVAPPARAAQCMAAVKRQLVSEAGALLLTPAYSTPDESIGYITRYAPGLRENGGVYTHAATWAIAAAAKIKDRELVSRLLIAINPAIKDAERYWAEPYVLPGNVDGPESPYFGRGGWTWYTGSAAWLPRVFTHWVLGVRPELDGLRIDPCLPAGWKQARLLRPWRGCTYEIEIEQAARDADRDSVEVILDGVRLPTNLMPVPAATGERHEVRVRAT